ncbi:MAG: hypothetical protein J6U54_08795 [Clostridiales bacterium]|nr:hypothetical protein [Clostridiales bacterium]
MQHKLTYTELSKLITYEERFKYLMLKGNVGIETFGYDRYLNQMLYTSQKWKSLRDRILIRDNGMDMGLEGYPIYGRAIIHHINPLTVDDVINYSPDVFNPEYLVCVSHRTHNAIHYSEENYTRDMVLVERKPNDTIPWR